MSLGCRDLQRISRRAAALYTLLFWAFFLCVLLTSGWAQPPLQNPVIGDPAHVPQELADPFVLKWNGEYYIYFSGSPILAYQSADLVHWEPIGPVLHASEAQDSWNQADVWAPEVVFRNGKFYMYYTASRKSDDWRIGEMARRIGVAVSDSPRGPFIDSGTPVTPGWGIDGTVFKDPENGTEYLFYSYLYEPRFPGAGIVADRLAAWNRVAGEPSNITRGSLPWEDKDGDPNDGSLRYTNEAPTVIRHHGRYYMMYSGGSWDLSTSALAYASSDAPPHGGMESPGWNKTAAPILRSTSLVDGPGHNTLVKAPNNVDDICLYHARVVPFVEPWNRLPFADRLYWNYDRMFMQQPSLGDLPVPDRPAFSRVGYDTATAGAYRSGRVTRVIAQSGPYTNFIYELNLRTFPAELSKSGKGSSTALDETPGAGALIFFKDDDNWIRVSLESKALALRARLQGKNRPKATHDLPSGYVPEALHRLLITRNAAHVDVQLDGVNMLSADYEVRSPSTLGTFTAGMPVEFGYQAVTAFYEDTFDQPQSLSAWRRQPEGNWLVQEGALQQVAGGAGRSVALKGDLAENYESVASLLWHDNDSLESKAGVVAAAGGDREADMVLAGFDKNIWPFARFWVQHVVAGELRDSFSVGLPRGFQYDVYHTIRVVKQGTAFTFFLDGVEIADARFAFAASRPGVFSERARVAFDDVSMKQIVVAQNLILNGGFESEQWDGSQPAKSNPWTFSGSARVNNCCAHSGQRRLTIEHGEGAAQQIISDLEPGFYTLHAWVFSTAGSDSSLEVGTAHRLDAVAPAGIGPWHLVRLDFTVAAGQTEAIVRLSGKVAEGGLIAADDFYLYRK
jgi:GH43 family beta-xylosidase